MSATKYSAAQWLGLGGRTETEQPHELPFVQSVILARVAAKGWPDTVHEVLLEPFQFSAFNDTYGDPDDRYEQLAAKYPTGQLAVATACAAWTLGVPAARRPLSPRVCWFHSPRSMKPAGKTPGWAAGKRMVLAPGVDPWRFLFWESA